MYDVYELAEAGPEFRAGIGFLKGFGVWACGVGLSDGDAPIFTNGQEAKYAVLNGRTVTIREAEEASVTTIEGDSWGALNRRSTHESAGFVPRAFFRLVALCFCGVARGLLLTWPHQAIPS